MSGIGSRDDRMAVAWAHSHPQELVASRLRIVEAVSGAVGFFASEAVNTALAGAGFSRRYGLAIEAQAAAETREGRT